MQHLTIDEPLTFAIWLGVGDITEKESYVHLVRANKVKTEILLVPSFTFCGDWLRFS